MRTFVSAVAVLIGLVLAAVAVPAMWVDRNIVQEEGFVALTAPLGKDPVFQQRLAAAAVDSLAAEPDPRSASRTGHADPGQRGALADEHARLPRGLDRNPAQKPPAHFADPARCRRRLTEPPRSPWMSRRLSGWWPSRSRATTLPLEAPGPGADHISGSPTSARSSTAFPPSPRWATPLPSARLIAFALAFVAARRRWTVLVGMGVGTLVLAGVWKLASRRRRRPRWPGRAAATRSRRSSRASSSRRASQFRAVDPRCRRGGRRPAGSRTRECASSAGRRA